MFKFVFLQGAILFSLLSVSVQAESISFQTDHVLLELDHQANVLQFTQRQNGENLLRQQHPVKFCLLRETKTGPVRAAIGLQQQGSTLHFVFHESPIKLSLNVTTDEKAIVVELADVSGGDFYSLEFARIPLRAGVENENFVATALARSIETNTLDYPGKSTICGGICYHQTGTQGVGITLLALPEPEMREAIKERLSLIPAGKMPINRAGGAFAMDVEKNRQSYVIAFHAPTPDEAAELCKKLSPYGVKQIDFHQGQPFRQGDFEFNPKVYPNGAADFKKVTDRMRDEGCIAGLHTYSQFLHPQSRYVTPIPSRDLDVIRAWTLQADLSETETNLSVAESTADVSEHTGYMIHNNSRILRIDDELILLGKPLRESPFGFSECVRGAYGTRVSAHPKGSSVEQLRVVYDMLVPRNGSELFFEIARETARAYNEGGFEMIYLDALDGTYSVTQDTNLYGYYCALFVNEILKNVKTPPLLEYSTMCPALWYGRSRVGAWDAPHRGYTEFFERHCRENIQTGHRLYLPAQFGWLSLCPSEGDDLDNFQYHILFSEDIDDLGTKCLAYDFGLSYLDITRKALQPFTVRNGQRLALYDRLRCTKTLPEELKIELRRSDRKFMLQQISDDQWRCVPARYDRMVITSEKKLFEIDNSFLPQKPMIRIEHRHSCAEEPCPEAIPILEWDENQPIKSSVIKEYPNGLDLSKHLGLGIWVFGDSGGAQLNLRLDSPVSLVSGHTDHFIDIDFDGWRYFQLVEAENGTRTNVNWPLSCNRLYHEFRQKVHYKKITQVTLMAVGPSENLRFRTVHALPVLPKRLLEVSLQCGNEKTIFQGEMQNGHFAQFEPGSEVATIYDATGTEQGTMKRVGPPLLLPTGKSAIHVSTKCDSGQNTPVRITIGMTDESSAYTW